VILEPPLYDTQIVVPGVDPWPGRPHHLYVTRYAEFTGGLGDMLHTFYTGDKYAVLESLRPDEAVGVVLTVHNPHAIELFQWHPRVDQLRILNLGFHPPDAAFRERQGIPRTQPPGGGGPSWPLAFYPAPGDLQLLRELGRSRTVAFVGSAGMPERNVPMPVLEAAARICLEEGLVPVFLGRRYDHRFAEWAVPSGLHLEQAAPEIPGVVDAIDALTVPGTLMALEKARVVFTAHSSMCMAAWFMRRPVFLLYPKAVADVFFPGGHRVALGYMEGIDRPETWDGMFDAYDSEVWRGFLRRWALA